MRSVFLNRQRDQTECDGEHRHANHAGQDIHGSLAGKAKTLLLGIGLKVIARGQRIGKGRGIEADRSLQLSSPASWTAVAAPSASHSPHASPVASRPSGVATTSTATRMSVGTSEVFLAAPSAASWPSTASGPTITLGAVFLMKP